MKTIGKRCAQEQPRVRCGMWKVVDPMILVAVMQKCPGSALIIRYVGGSDVLSEPWTRYSEPNVSAGRPMCLSESRAYLKGRTKPRGA